MPGSSAMSCGQPRTSTSASSAGAMPRSTETVLERLLAGIERELDHAVELRHELHAHPELAHAEQWTAETVERALPVPSLVVAGTGRVARIGSDAGQPVAV